jgi:hypothetical protein
VFRYGLMRLSPTSPDTQGPLITRSLLLLPSAAVMSNLVEPLIIDVASCLVFGVLCLSAVLVLSRGGWSPTARSRSSAAMPLV